MEDFPLLVPVLVLFAAMAAFVGLGIYAGIRFVARNRRERGAIPISPPGPLIETRPPGSHPPPDGPLTLRLGHNAWWRPASWALGLGVGAYLLFTDPEALWTAWIAWPAAAAMALAAPFKLQAAWRGAHARLVATSEGVTFLRGSGENRIAWRSVGEVRLMNYWRRGKESLATGARTVSYIERRTLQLRDHDGRVLLEVDAPLRPAEGYAAFLDAVLVWSAAPVREQK